MTLRDMSATRESRLAAALVDVGRGDMDAVATLWSGYGALESKLRHGIGKALSDWEWEDVWQDVWTRTIERIVGKADLTVGKLGSYLTIAVRNAIIDLQRQSSFRSFVRPVSAFALDSHDDPWDWIHVDDAVSPPDVAIARCERDQWIEVVRRAIATARRANPRGYAWWSAGARNVARDVDGMTASRLIAALPSGRHQEKLALAAFRRTLRAELAIEASLEFGEARL